MEVSVDMPEETTVSQAATETTTAVAAAIAGNPPGWTEAQTDNISVATAEKNSTGNATATTTTTSSSSWKNFNPFPHLPSFSFFFTLKEHQQHLLQQRDIMENKESHPTTCTISQVLSKISAPVIDQIWRTEQMKSSNTYEVRFEYILQYLEVTVSPYFLHESMNNSPVYPFLNGMVKDSLNRVVEQIPKEDSRTIGPFLLSMLLNTAFQQSKESIHMKYNIIPTKGLGARILLEGILRRHYEVVFSLLNELKSYNKIWDQNTQTLEVVGWFLVLSFDSIGLYAFAGWLELFYPYLYGFKAAKRGVVTEIGDKTSTVDDFHDKLEIVLCTLEKLIDKLPQLRHPSAEQGFREDISPHLLPSILMASFTRSSIQRNALYIQRIQTAYDKLKQFIIQFGFSSALFEAILECVNRDGAILKDESVRLIVEFLCAHSDTILIWGKMYPSVIVPSQSIIRYLESNWSNYRLQVIPNKNGWKKFALTVHTHNIKNANLKEKEWLRSSVRRVGRNKLLENDQFVQKIAKDIIETNRYWELFLTMVGKYYSVLRNQSEYIANEFSKFGRSSSVWFSTNFKLVSLRQSNLPNPGMFLPLSFKSKLYS